MCEGTWLAQDQSLKQYAVRFRNILPSHNRFLLKLLLGSSFSISLQRDNDIWKKQEHGAAALGWAHGTLLAPRAHRAARGEREAAAATGTASFPPHHCFAQPESPFSVSPITFTSIFRPVRVLLHMPCQPPKTSSPCFLHSVWYLSTVLHLQGQSTALSFSSTNIQFQVMMIPPCNPLISSFSHGNWRDILLPWEQLPAASAMPPTVNLHILLHP